MAKTWTAYTKFSDQDAAEALAEAMEDLDPEPTGVGVFEIVAGLVLASGFMTRIASVALIVFTALATLFFHERVTDQAQAAMALKNLAVIGGLLMVFAYGQVRGQVGLWRERDRAHDAEIKAARAEGKAEATTTVVHDDRPTRPA